MSRARLSREAGFTLIEVLAAWAILLIALTATLKVFSSAQDGTTTAERRSTMVSVVQRELERIRALPYAQVGLDGAPVTSGEGAAIAGSATEPVVSGGLLEPGPTFWRAGSAQGRMYRHVTWRAQPCSGLAAKVAAAVEVRAGAETGSAAAELNNMCTGSQHTKRVAVTVVADTPGVSGRQPLRIDMVLADPSTLVRTSADSDSLSTQPAAPGSTPTPTAQEQIYADSVTQNLHLYDTSCDNVDRQPPSGNHPTKNTGRDDRGCNSTIPPDLMGTTAPSGTPVDYDYSDDLLRPAAYGLALKRDTVNAPCADDVLYGQGDQNLRKWSIHRWVTRPMSADAETLASGGRAALTLYTRSVGGVRGAGRLCIHIRRHNDRALLGKAEFYLQEWPRQFTAMTVAFDLAHITLNNGDRVELIVRAHPDSDNDIEVLYDRPDAPSNLSLTMKKTKPLP
jgi:prepilin-type N-terminal cleavage/methylation domain-containing protein